MRLKFEVNFFASVNAVVQFILIESGKIILKRMGLTI
jgi:hypothetical protein